MKTIELDDDNYERWSICMRSYLVSKDLWKAIELSERPSGVDETEWIKTDAAALHAIQISCGEESFEKIKDINSAKCAWNKLAQRTTEGEEGEEGGEGEEEEEIEVEEEPPSQEDAPAIPNMDRTSLIQKLEDAVVNGDVDLVRELTRAPHADNYEIVSTLRLAVYFGRIKIVEALLDLMSEDKTEEKDEQGYTALSLAALAGRTEIAKCLVKRNCNLLTITDGHLYIPLVAACSAGYKEVARYLYYATPFSLLLPENGNQGYMFLVTSIQNKIYDIALHALDRLPDMMTRGGKLAPLMELARTPSEFLTGRKLRFWQQWIYYCLNVKKPSFSSSNDHQVTIPEDLQEAMGPGELYRKSSMLLQCTEIKRIYDLKLTHVLAREIQRLMCKQIVSWRTWEIRLYKDEVKAAIFKAIENGMVDFVIEMITSFNPDMVATFEDDRGRNILMAAIGFRQEEIANFIYGSDPFKSLISGQDNDRNSLLHIAGNMAPTVQHDPISVPALKMQRELQWYKEVENIVYFKETTNKFGRTPYYVFTRAHRPLLHKAEAWMRHTATCYTVVGTLIITVIFAAAFTIPGGNYQETGLPIFIKRKAFTIYMIFDAVSLFAASTSVLTFLVVLPSCYSVEDFHKYVPTKLIIGLSSLFISVVAMMIAFCSALFLMLQRRWWILIPCMLLASIPVTLFVWLQFPLLVEIFNLTYRSPIFVRKRSVTKKASFLKKIM